jgi:hypothetical protein
VAVNDDRVVRVWTQVAQQSRGATVSVAHVCAAAVADVGVDGAGVTVMASPAARDTVHATDAVASELEQLQITLGQGPCLDTFADGGPVLAVDLRARDYQTRWPAFAPAALRSGAGAVFALPLQVGAIRLGAMDLYRRRPGELRQPQLADALAYAEAVCMLLLDMAGGAPPGTAESARRRDDPTAHQAVVHQATGMVLVQLGVSADAALVRLRAHAFAQDRPLAAVARDVVERRLRFKPDPPGGHPR